MSTQTGGVKMQKTKEQELIKKAKANDTTAFAQLYSSVYEELYRFALYMVKNPQDAEDVVSETVITAYENIPKLRKEEAFRGWIFKILMNRCKRRLAERGHFTVQQEWEEQKIVYDYGIKMDIKKALWTLSEEERYIVTLSVFGGYNSTEIGNFLSKKAVTVRSKRSRALEKMKQLLQ